VIGIYTIRANGLDGRDSRAYEVEPESNLPLLLVERVRYTEHDAVDTVRVTDEMIVADVVATVARELPHAQVTGT